MTDLLYQGNGTLADGGVNRCWAALGPPYEPFPDWLDVYANRNYGQWDGLMVDDMGATFSPSYTELPTQDDSVAEHRFLAGQLVDWRTGTHFLQVDNSWSSNPYQPPPTALYDDSDRVRGPDHGGRAVEQRRQWRPVHDHARLERASRTLGLRERARRDGMGRSRDRSGRLPRVALLRSRELSGSARGREPARGPAGAGGDRVARLRAGEDRRLGGSGESGRLAGERVRSGQRGPGGLARGGHLSDRPGPVDGRPAWERLPDRSRTRLHLRRPQRSASAEGRCRAYPSGGYVYRREFRDCFNRGAPIGPCATIVNDSGTPEAVLGAWLGQSYRYVVTPEPGARNNHGWDVQSGGWVNTCGRRNAPVPGQTFKAGSTSIAPWSAIVIDYGPRHPLRAVGLDDPVVRSPDPTTSRHEVGRVLAAGAVRTCSVQDSLNCRPWSAGSQAYPLVLMPAALSFARMQSTILFACAA